MTYIYIYVIVYIDEENTKVEPNKPLTTKPMKISTYKMTQANGVMKALKRIVKDKKVEGNYLYATNYSNGREQGFHIEAWPKKAVSFSEARSSDSIVVYFGNQLDFNTSGWPSEDVYQRNAVYFPYKKYDQAAKFIAKHLLTK